MLCWGYLKGSEGSGIEESLATPLVETRETLPFYCNDVEVYANILQKNVGLKVLKPSNHS